MNYERFLNYLSLELPEYEIKYSNELNDFELIKAIHQQLADGMPVPVFLDHPILITSLFMIFIPR
jgi:hypothetical protein